MRRREAWKAWIVFSMLLAACGSHGPTQPPPPWDALTKNERLWSSARIDSYSYRFGWQCNCDVRVVDITVREGRAASVIDVETGTVLDSVASQRYRTVDGLFTFVRDALKGAPAVMAARYHPSLGYPTEVFIDYDAQVIDDEMGFRVYWLVVHRSR